MQRIEQAVFTLIETGRAAGYQVVAGSPGVCEADVRELAVWGPSHDSMLETGPEAESINFHPLPSGAYCISRTTSVGWDRHDGEQRAHTQCLIISPETLARFGNNPLALVDAVAAEGLWQVHDLPGSRLEPLWLTGGAAAVDQLLLGRLAAEAGPENMAALVQAARDTVCLAISGTPSPALLIAGLFSCLPPECRLEFSFSTGLKFSPRRPFRLVALCGDAAEKCWLANYPNVVVLELRAGEVPRPMPIDGWARLIERTLSTDRIPFLAAQVSKRRFNLTLDDLPALGLQLLEDLEAAELDSHQEMGETPSKTSPLPAAQRADAPHQQFSKNVEQSLPTATRAAGPATCIAPNAPEVLEKLERLDDLVYEAINGHTGAMEQLQTTWPELAQQLSEELLTESREQYLRYALSIWEQCVLAGALRQPSRAIQALDVICLLFGEAT